MKKELKVLLCRGVAVRRLITGAFAGLLLMFCASYLNAQIITVTNCNDSGSGSLRDAVSRAQTSDTINFSPATDGHAIVLISGGLVIDKNLNVIGNGPKNTIVDGDHIDIVFRTSGSSVFLKNMTIQNGGANTTNASGGGIANAGNLTIINCNISNNKASGLGGGGIYNDFSGTLEVINSEINNNIASSYGGGIYNVGNSVTIVNSTITANEALQNGGAIYQASGTLTIINSTIANNDGYGSGGGGIYDNHGTLKIFSSTIAANFTGGQQGGGLYLYNYSTLTISNSTCANNHEYSTRDDFYNDPTSTINDWGYNIIGYSMYHVWAKPGDWTWNSGSADTYTEVGTGTTGQLLLASNLTYNGGANLTLVPGIGSIAIGNGTDSGIPNTDQRGYIRKSTPDIGAFETNGIVAYNGNTPYTSIQSAIDAANPKDTIELISAQIKESGINVNKNVIIEGAGADTTYVQADLTPGTATDRIFNITSGATLDSMTIRNGDTSGIGGGILYSATGTNVYINNCVVSDNTASEGGGIASTDGTLNLQNSMVLGNQSVSEYGTGGGILCRNATIQNSTIASNHTTLNGGGIEIMGYTTPDCIDFINIINSTIFNNNAGGEGGGIDFSGNDILFIANSTIAGNSSATGAGINVNKCNLFTIRNSIIANNIGQNDFNTYGEILIDGNYNVVGVSNNPKMWVGNGDWLDQNNTGTFTNGTKQGQLFLANALADNGGPTLTLNFTDPSSIAVYQAIPRGITNFNFSPNTDQRGVIRTGKFTAIGAFNDNQSGN